MSVPYYCCDKRCFVKDTVEVDGMACARCQAYSQCHCRCITYMETRTRKYCCELKCFSIHIDEPWHLAYGMVCENCRGLGRCYCKCKTRMDIVAYHKILEEHGKRCKEYNIR